MLTLVIGLTKSVARIRNIVFNCAKQDVTVAVQKSTFEGVKRVIFIDDELITGGLCRPDLPLPFFATTIYQYTIRYAILSSTQSDAIPDRSGNYVQNTCVSLYKLILAKTHHQHHETDQ